VEGKELCFETALFHFFSVFKFSMFVFVQRSISHASMREGRIVIV
jgi:hypothetical protein